MSQLHFPAHGRTMNTMTIKATVQVDFHLSPDGRHTLALADDVSPDIALEAGDLVTVTDGDVEHLATVDSVAAGIVSLVVAWNEPMPAGSRG